MAKSKLINVNKKIEEHVVKGYKAIENGVVGGHKKIEEGAVKGFEKISDQFVDRFLTKEGESVKDAKKEYRKKKNCNECWQAESIKGEMVRY